MNIARPLNPVSLEEFEAMEKDERLTYELIDGVVMASPSPSREHQTIANKVNYSLLKTFENSSCEVLYEFDIKFDGDILKPDLMLFCDKDAELPEIIFEILSPSTRQKDILVKPICYQAMGVKEYWIIDPKVKIVIVHDFINQTAESYGLGDTIQSKARPEISITVADIFA